MTRNYLTMTVLERHIAEAITVQEFISLKWTTFLLEIHRFLYFQTSP